MIGYSEFIIKVDFVFSKTFKTESGLELHADSRFSQDRLSNRIAEVVEVPLVLKEKTPIKKGYQIMIDPTIYYGGNFIVTGQQLSPFVIDIPKGLYKIQDSMIVLYRENENSEWKANEGNLLVRFNREQTEDKKVGNLIVEQGTKKVSETEAKVLYSNNELMELGVNNGDEILVNKGYGVSFWIDGVEYNWIFNDHVLAKLN